MHEIVLLHDKTNANAVTMLEQASKAHCILAHLQKQESKSGQITHQDNYYYYYFYINGLVYGKASEKKTSGEGVHRVNVQVPPKICQITRIFISNKALIQCKISLAVNTIG